MNVLLLTLVNLNDIDGNNVYQATLREFAKHHNQVFLVSPTEKKNNKKTHIIKKQNCMVLKVKTGNVVAASNIIEKGIATIMLESQFISAIKKYFTNVKFDIVLYSTPPITLAGAVKYIKKRDGAMTYLMLKDIFPQNAIDIGMMASKGVRGLMYKYFRCKEETLYGISDYIGCMSPANVKYVIEHNVGVNKTKVEVCANSIEAIDMSVDTDEKISLRRKYGIPEDRIVFVYGGNLGKPQDIPFIIRCLKTMEKVSKEYNAYFLIIGSGTEYYLLEEYVNSFNPKHVKLMSRIPKEDYDAMVGSCDVGLIFLDHRFTIPNFPSRLLSYMQAKLPVLACTDPNTDIGQVIEKGCFGYWCESNDSKAFMHRIERMCHDDLNTMGQNAWNYLNAHYTVEQAYHTIMRHFEQEEKSERINI